MKASRSKDGGQDGAASEMVSSPPPATTEIAARVRRHLVFGWGAILFFLTLGIVLEALHGLKVGWYVNPSGSARRLMWTLAHAHGTLLGLIHVAFAVTLPWMGRVEGRRMAWVSACLRAATYLLPGGFFLGGLVTYGGDPGLGVFLVPPGALALLAGVGGWWVSIRKA